MQYSITFPTGKTDYLYQNAFDTLKQLFTPEQCILITDSNIAASLPELFQHFKTIIIPGGEGEKNLQRILLLTEELLKLEAHRKTTLVGVGGGVITDITGFLSAVYMRGISVGFVPTTLLAMVDAAIGGKNGVNTDHHKNILGTIRQPSFIIFDPSLLTTLLAEEWSNGFAEIIKYACLFEEELFEELERNDINHYRNDAIALQALIKRCADWKNKMVLADEKETGERKLLNFGHTAGHAIEKIYALPHGHAVAIGIVIACKIAEQETGLKKNITERIINLLIKYQLPTHVKFDAGKVLDILSMDKKRDAHTVDYILLEDIGKPVVKPMTFDSIHKILEAI